MHVYVRPFVCLAAREGEREIEREKREKGEGEKEREEANTKEI